MRVQFVPNVKHQILFLLGLKKRKNVNLLVKINYKKFLFIIIIMTKKKNNNKKKIIEHFNVIESLLWFFPFFIRYPCLFFLYLLQKSLTNPLYLIGLFILFMVIKKVVRMHTVLEYEGEM